MHAKTLDCAKLADIVHGETETPGKFLDRPWEALPRFTDVDLESAEGEMILKIDFSFIWLLISAINYENRCLDQASL